MSAAGTVVDVAIPYPLVWGQGDLEIRVEGRVFEVHFERRFRQAGDPAVFGSHIISAVNLERRQDRSGSVSHTELTIQFPMYVTYDIARHEELYEWVLVVVNRLLEVYRYATGDFYVSNIPRRELDVQRIRKTLKEDETLENREILVGGAGAGPADWLTVPRTEPILDEARQYLREDTALAIPRVLFLNAQREEFYENYRIAVVEAETAFEALVDEVVAQYYRRQGLSKAQVDNKLKAGLQGLIKNHLPRCCRQSFENTTEHKAWDTDLYKLRNDVVHDGAPVTASQAERALRAAEQALLWIETHCL